MQSEESPVVKWSYILLMAALVLDDYVQHDVIGLAEIIQDGEIAPGEATL